MSSILVVGSSSNVGRPLVEQLIESGEQVRAATRNPSQFKGPGAAEAAAFDYGDPGTFSGALEGADRVFVLGPPTPAPHTVMLPFVEAAVRDNRKLVLMTAMGTEFDEDGSLRQVERALEGSGSPFVILRPNWFMDNLHTGWVEPIKQAGLIPVPAEDARTSLIDARDIAASAAAALTSDRFDGQAFTLTGPEAVTYEEAATILSEATGKEIRYQPIDDETFIQSLVDEGVPADLANYLAELFGFVRQGATASVTTAVADLTGKPPRTLMQYAKDHATAWT